MPKVWGREMSLIEQIKKILFNEDTVSQEIIAQKMKNEIYKLENEYKELISLQDVIIDNPKSIVDMNFTKKEKYIELMDHLRYKNINLIKEYEFIGMKYNILVELYKKVKEYILNVKGNLLISFSVDKYKQPVAIISPYEEELHKILLIKNTFSKEDYVEYTIGENTEILDICSQETNVNHGYLMMSMLFNTINHLRDNNLITSNRIIVSNIVKNKYGKSNIIGFFKKLGFTEVDGEIVKVI